MLGSPPQVRGKHYLFILFYRDPGITPAGAGKTFQVLVPQFDNRDHPRRCGENLFTLITFAEKTGSPPQVRGKLYRFVPVRRHNRITPAGAGKT